MGNPVVHFEVIGKDGAKLQKFYGDVFGWEIRADNPMNYGMINRPEDGVGIGGGISGGMPESEEGQGVTFYVEVPNLEECLAAVGSNGGSTVMPPDDVPGGPRMAQFIDPEGHRIGLVQAGSMRSE